MNKLRQRIPFRFSEDEQTDERIMDEQEQEELIESLRKESLSHTKHYYKFLQGCLSFTILFHVWFLVSPRQITPAHIFFPYVKTPLPNLIPFATFFTLLDILVLLNVVLHLPKDLSFPRLLHTFISNFLRRFPSNVQEMAHSYIPLTLAWSASLLCFPPSLAVLTATDIPQILWWSSPLLVVGIVVLVRSWIKELDTDMESLEKVKYEAKGA